MDLGLSGKFAVVTGGSSGIGAAVVETLAKQGCDVAFCGRSQDRIDRQLARLESGRRDGDGRVSGSALDVTDADALVRWVNTLGRIDIVVANVSALSPDWDAALNIDVRATRNLVEATVPRMAGSTSRAITYIGSKASSFATPGFEAYGAAKAAMAHYMKSTATKLIVEGIRVNVVSPGDTFVEEGFWDTIRQNNPGVYDATVAANPMGRLCTPMEVARVVAFISSPAASFVAGANWYVDGGATAHVQI